MDIGKRLSKNIGNTVGEGPVGGSTDQFHETEEAGRIVDSVWQLGNSLQHHGGNHRELRT